MPTFNVIYILLEAVTVHQIALKQELVNFNGAFRNSRYVLFIRLF